jgi:hypothetical protein
MSETRSKRITKTSSLKSDEGFKLDPFETRICDLPKDLQECLVYISEIRDFGYGEFGIKYHKNGKMIKCSMDIVYKRVIQVNNHL